MKVLNNFILVKHLEDDNKLSNKSRILTVTNEKQFIRKAEAIVTRIKDGEKTADVFAGDTIYYPADVDMLIKDDLYAVNLDYVICKE